MDAVARGSFGLRGGQISSDKPLQGEERIFAQRDGADDQPYGPGAHCLPEFQ